MTENRHDEEETPVPNGEASADEHGHEVEALEPEAETGEEAPADEKLAEDAAALKEQLLRALAETENVRRRAQKDVSAAGQYSIANFARDLLPVADNMSRALESIPEAARNDDERLRSLAEGVEMTARELASVFERHGLREVSPLGEKFDYNLHQAMFEVDDVDQPAGTVVQVAQVGYVIGDRLLRPAMVGVAKGGPKAESTDVAGKGDAVEEGEAAGQSNAQLTAENGEGGSTENVGGKIDRSV